MTRSDFDFDVISGPAEPTKELPPAPQAQMPGAKAPRKREADAERAKD